MSSPSRTRSSSKQLRSGKLVQDIPVVIYTPKGKRIDPIEEEQNPFKPKHNLNKEQTDQPIKRNLLPQLVGTTSDDKDGKLLDDIDSIKRRSEFYSPTSVLFTDKEVNQNIEKFNTLTSIVSNPEIPKKNFQFENNILVQLSSNQNQQTNMSPPSEIYNFDVSTFHKSVPEFDGNMENLNRFIACCEHFHSNLPNDNVKSTFLKALVRKFVGRAFDFYNKKESWESWDELKLALKSYFSPTQSFEGYQIELCRCKQDKLSVRECGEKIEKILVEINKISNRIEVEGTNGGIFFKIQNEKLAIKAFLNGLNEPLKTILRSRKYELVQDAIKDAIEIENEEILSNIQKMNIIDQNTLIDNKKDQKELKYQVNNSIIDNKKMICFKCNKPGHSSRNCFQNQNFNNNVSRQINNKQNQFNFSHYDINRNRDNYQQFGQRSNYNDRSFYEQQNKKAFINNYNYNRQNNYDRNFSNGNGRYNQNSYGNNHHYNYRSNEMQNNQGNQHNYQYGKPNKQPTPRYSQNNVQFRNEPNYSMQTCTQSKNTQQQSPQLDSVALDFHLN